MNFLTVFWVLLVISVSATLYYKAMKLYREIIEAEKRINDFINEHFAPIEAIYKRKASKTISESMDNEIINRIKETSN